VERTGESRQHRAITIRSILFGLAGILFIAALAPLYDNVIVQGGSPMIGIHMPVGGFLFFLLVALFWNFLFSSTPGLMIRGRARRALLTAFGGLMIFWGVFMIVRYAGSMMQKGITAYPAGPGGLYAFLWLLVAVAAWNILCRINVPLLVLNPKELVVVLAATLASCFVPTSGLFRYFHKQLVLPWHFFRSGAFSDWVKYDVLSYVPDKLWPRPAPVLGADGVPTMDAEVYEGFITGMARGQTTVALSDLPLAGWLPALAYWGPLVLLCSICVVALSVIVHRQWVHHEQLSYPIAQVATSFLRRERGKGIPDLFRKRLFWCSFIPVFCLFFIEYINLWFPSRTPGMTEVLPAARGFWFWRLHQTFPMVRVAPMWMNIAGQTLFFCIIGLAYFVASEISLTVGLTHPIFVAFGILFFTMTGDGLPTGDIEFTRAGAYIGYAIILLYTGRTYYRAVFRRALLLGGQVADTTAVTAARILLFAAAAFVILLIWMGVTWTMAILYALLLLLMFMVFTRIICETGIPFLQANWVPGTVLVSIFGPAAVGPGPLVLLFFFNTILAQDLRECLMPYAATAMKVGEDARVRIGKVFAVVIPAVVVALVVAFLALSWIHYNYGGLRGDANSSRVIPTQPFNDAVRSLRNMDETGLLEQSASLGAVERFRLFSPNGKHVGLLLAGLVCVTAVCMLRFRFSRFPVHPVVFVLFGTYPAAQLWFSFLVGWGVKSLVVRFGGGKVYQRLKPLFIGLIAAELIAAGLAVLVELVYYWIVGEPAAKNFGVLPA